MFIADKITEKRRAGDRVRNARFLSNINSDELRAWLCETGSIRTFTGKSGCGQKQTAQNAKATAGRSSRGTELRRNSL